MYDLYHKFNVQKVGYTQVEFTNCNVRMQFPFRFGLPVNFQGMVMLPQKKQVFCDFWFKLILSEILNIRWKSFGSVWTTSTSTWTLPEGNNLQPLQNSPIFSICCWVISFSPSKPSKCLYFLNPGMWRGERTYQQDWLDLGRFSNVLSIGSWCNPLFRGSTILTCTTRWTLTWWEHRTVFSVARNYSESNISFN